MSEPVEPEVPDPGRRPVARVKRPARPAPPPSYQVRAPMPRLLDHFAEARRANRRSVRRRRLLLGLAPLLAAGGVLGLLYAPGGLGAAAVGLALLAIGSLWLWRGRPAVALDEERLGRLLALLEVLNRERPDALVQVKVELRAEVEGGLGSRAPGPPEPLPQGPPGREPTGWLTVLAVLPDASRLKLRVVGCAAPPDTLEAELLAPGGKDAEELLERVVSGLAASPWWRLEAPSGAA